MKILNLTALFFLIYCKSNSQTAPYANFMVSDSVVEIGEVIILFDASKNADAYAWHFGEDAYQANDSSWNKIAYSTAGYKVISLTVSNPQGAHTCQKRLKVLPLKKSSALSTKMIVVILLAIFLLICLLVKRILSIKDTNNS
jgi:PKD repeat protein